jgi:hypothetical protein
MSFATGAILEAKKESLIKQNDEAKRRRSAKLNVIGRVKVISYEDLNEARAKRAAKDQATADKGKRAQKRKGPAKRVAAVVNSKSELEVVEDEIVAAGMVAHCSVFQL